MGNFELGRVSCSKEVDLALSQSGVKLKDLLAEHQANAPGEDCWVASSFTLPNFDRTVWAITNLSDKSTALLFEGV